MRRLTWSVATLAILLLACNVSGPPAATPDESALQTRVAQSVAATLTAMPSATPVPLQPTDTPSPTSLPLPPTPQPPVPDYAIEEERIIGSYVIRVWRNPASDPLTFDSILTISSAGQPQARIEFFAGLGKETGTDITGEGHPDVVVSVFSGGAHCCFSTVVYNLGPALMKVMETPLSNCDGYFQDLNGDGALEFITCDDSFVYEYCSFASSPTVKVVLQYQPGRDYVPASPLFPQVYAEDIARDLRLAEEATPGEMGEWDSDTKCSVLPLILDYLYSGQEDAAWAALNRFYEYPDAEEFRAEIERTVSESPLFASGD